MKKAEVRVNGVSAAIFEEERPGGPYRLRYLKDYSGPPVSLTLLPSLEVHEFDVFPPFFDGLLPEGPLLHSMLRQTKLDRTDSFGQLLTVGQDLVGAVTVHPIP